MNVTPPYRIWGAYESFIEAFSKAVYEAGKDVKFPDRPVRSCFSYMRPDPISGQTRAVFEQYLYLKGWPSKNLDPKKRLDVVVKALETFTTPEWSLTKSTVYLNYLIVSNSIAHLVQSLHYDFVAGGQLDHPLFHVQLTLELIPETDLLNEGEGFYDKLRLPRRRECWVTTRIPTPDMTLPSVLYCLVADHLESGIFKQFAEKVESMLQDQLPPPNCDTLWTSLRKSSVHFKSSHWFAHNT
jgi:hypothetical protein